MISRIMIIRVGPIAISLAGLTTNNPGAFRAYAAAPFAAAGVFVVKALTLPPWEAPLR
jgi:hypothetical protein